MFVLTFVESVNNIVNRIAFISTATCENKWRNSPLIRGLSFAYSHCPMSQRRHNDAATPAASLSLLIVTCKDVFSWTTGFQLLRGPFPAATLMQHSWDQGKCRKKRWCLYLAKNDQDQSKHETEQPTMTCPAAPWFFSRTKAQGDNPHCCLGYHYQPSPCAAMLDMKKYSCSLQCEVQTLRFLKSHLVRLPWK